MALFAGQALYARAAFCGDHGAGFAVIPHHIGISVPDLDESIAWYREMLGFRLVRRMHKEANPEMDFALLRRGDAYIELFDVVDGRPMPDYRRDPTADLYVHGTKHFAFRVEDARAAAADLRARGAEIALGPVEIERVIFVFIRDNAGNPFELIQFKQPPG
jgi:methylmalonyl-CoA/ethylmalonyl-CoA epimerase